MDDEKSVFVFEPLTWELLEKDMQNAFGTAAKFGENRKAQVAEANGGFVSQVVFVIFDWIGENLENLPKKAVVKVTTFQELQKVLEKMEPKSTKEMTNIGAMINDNELNFYRNHQKWGLDGDFLVKFFCGRNAGDRISAGYIALEWIEGIEARYQYDCVDEVGFLEILKMTAKIHSTAILKPEIVQDIKKNVPETVYSQLFSAESTCASLDLAKKEDPSKAEQIDLLKKFSQIYDHFDEKRPKMETSSKKLLCHGDLTIANFLWNRVDGELRPRIALDWQMCHIGNPMTDLSRLFAISLSPEELKSNRNNYLQFYHDNIAKSASKKGIPWKTKDELIKDFEKVFPIEMVLVTSMLLPIVDILLRTCPENRKEETAKEFRRKLFGILDLCEEFVKKYH